MSIWTNMSFAGYPGVFQSVYSNPNEITRLIENESNLTRVFNLSDCSSTVGSYFHDRVNSKLNIHTTNSDTPRNSKYLFIAYFWVCVTNNQSSDYPAVYKCQDGETYGNVESCEYLPFLENKANSIFSSVSETYQGSVKMQSGGLSLSNASYWYNYKETWVFLNRPVFIKVGQIDDLYADFITFFTGKCMEPQYSDSGCNIPVEDARYGILGSIPPELFTASRYPNIEDGKADTPIPILLGEKTDITPVCIQEQSGTNQYAPGDCEDWYDASHLRNWFCSTNVVRNAAVPHGGTYCAELQVSAGNSNERIRTVTDQSYGTYEDGGIWLNPGCCYRGRFYYYMSAVGKTALWYLWISINGTNYFWDNTAKKWTSVSTYNSLANAVAWTAETFYFYAPELIQQYENETDSIYPMYFQFQRLSAASSSIYFDSFTIVERQSYKVSRTVFNDDFANIIELSAIDDVYQAGVALVSGTDYYAYLQGGVILLAASPGSDAITCDAHGLEIEYDFTTGALVSPNAFSENVADFLYFTLRILNNIPVADFDLTNFNLLQTARAQRLGWYLTDLTETIQFIEILQKSTVFHYLITKTGLHSCSYFNRSVPNSTKTIFSNDFARYSFAPGSKSVFYQVVLKWGKHPMNDTYQTYSIQTEDVFSIYGEKKTLESDTGIITALTQESEAAALAEFYAAMIEKPPAKIRAKIIDPKMLDVSPTEKVYVNREITTDESDTITLHNEDLYTVIENRRNLKELTCEMLLAKSIDVSGEAIHGNTPHSNHDDSVPVHSNKPAVNIPHSNTTPHDNTDHVDIPGVHTDENPHTDHDDLHHTDKTTHIDTTTPHSDTPHTNHNDHANTPHVNTPHSNHNDTVHTNYNIPHTDSWI